MCFKKLQTNWTKVMTTNDDVKLIKEMMKRNDFYYKEEEKRGWSNINGALNGGEQIWCIHYYGWTPIGFTAYKMDTTRKTKKKPYEDPFVWVLYLLVDNPYQKQGFGTQIMNGYKDMTANNNQYCLVIDLDITKHTFRHLVRYYTAMGFEFAHNGMPDEYGQIILHWNYKSYKRKEELY